MELPTDSTQLPNRRVQPGFVITGQLIKKNKGT